MAWGFSLWAHNYPNLNANNAVSNFGVYEIKANNTLYKVGKADLNRVTKSSGLPTRVHQQVRKLQGIPGNNDVTGKVVQDLGEVTTQAAKAAETARLQAIFDDFGFVPQGNQLSFFP